MIFTTIYLAGWAVFLARALSCRDDVHAFAVEKGRPIWLADFALALALGLWPILVLDMAIKAIADALAITERRK